MDERYKRIELATEIVMLLEIQRDLQIKINEKQAQLEALKHDSKTN